MTVPRPVWLSQVRHVPTNVGVLLLPPIGRTTHGVVRHVPGNLLWQAVSPPRSLEADVHRHNRIGFVRDDGRSAAEVPVRDVFRARVVVLVRSLTAVVQSLRLGPCDCRRNQGSCERYGPQ